MKKLLTVFILLSCVYTSATAQKFSIGLCGGINYSLPAFGMREDVYKLKDVSGNLGAAAGIRFMFDAKKIQFGLNAEWQKLGYDYKVDYVGFPISYRVRQGISELLLFANYKTLLPRSYVYYGLSTGFTIMREGWADNTYESTVGIYHDNGDLWTAPFGGKNVLVFGAQAGYSFRINKHFNVSGEVALRYLPGEMYVDVHGVNYEKATLILDKRGIMHFPVTAGINYTF